MFAEDGAEGENAAKKDADEYVVPAFSAQAKTLVRAKMQQAAAATGGDEELWEDADEQGEDEDDEMLCDNIDKMRDELKRIDEHVEDIEVDINDLDKAAFAVPDTDDGFKSILK